MTNQLEPNGPDRSDLFLLLRCVAILAGAYFLWSAVILPIINQVA